MTAVDGLIFDLDGTLLDRNAVFVKVAGNFYDEHLDNLTTMARGEAVDMMVRWDGDGYSDREWMRSQWLSQWPKTGLDTESLRVWYRSAMERHIEPDVEIIDFLTGLNHRSDPLGHSDQWSRKPARQVQSGGTGAGGSFHHSLGRSWLREAGPEDISRRSCGHGS